ncbi:MAG: hypothetical protein AUG07_08925 [Acidobacteria bacterium 13_1_20CM_2_60_10]|nr:MAG: hypothetical protein AUG07_08925 [Acidobacteria bacterium 13_1_20CM_2_60_10]
MKRKKRVQNLAAEIRRRLKDSGAPQHLGFSLESARKGRVVVRLDVRPHHKQIHGVVHGGIVATLAEINYLEAIEGGRVRAEARVLRKGRHFIVVECDVWSEQGKLAAKALLTFGAARGHTLAF